MKQLTNSLAYCLLIFLIGLSIVAKSQQPVFAPLQNQIKHIAFSADGSFLITGSDDHKVVLTDLRKRVALKEIKNVDFVAADEHRNFFYVKRNIESDSITLEKRSIPTADIVFTVKIPKKLNADKWFVENDLVNVNTPDETFQYVYREGYDLNAFKHLITFSKNGEVLEDLKTVIDGQINGFAKTNGTSWLVSSSALWKQNGATFEKILQPNFDKNAFANFKIKGDTIALLSNKEVQWYSIKNNKVFKQYDISSFVAEVSATYVNTPSMNLMKNHPFYLDSKGTVWLADKHISSQKTNQPTELFYKLAAIKDEKYYPLSTHLKAFFMDDGRIGEHFAYHEQKQVFALLVDDHVEIVDYKTGFLFSIGTAGVSADKLFFTNIPGQLLLTSGTSTNNPAYLLNLSNGWVETYGVIDHRSYNDNKAQFSNFKTSSKTFKPYNEEENKFEEIPMLENENALYLKLPLRKIFNLETLQKNISMDRDNILHFSNKEGVEVAKIELTIAKEKIGFNYVYKKYKYNEASNLLILFYASQRDFDIHQLWIDTEKKSVIKETIFKDLVLFKDGKRYACPQGIFNIDGTSIKQFSAKQAFELLTLSKNEDYLLGVVPGYTNGDQLFSWDWKKEQLLLLGKQLSIAQIIADPHSDLIFTRSSGGEVMIWNPLLPTLSASIKIIGASEFKNLSEIQAGYLILLSNGYYMASGRYNNLLSYTDPKNIYPASYVDGIYHRPDLVLTALGYAKNQKFLKTLASLAIKRGTKFKINTTGVDVTINEKNTIPYYLNNGLLEFSATISGSLKNAKTYMVYVNGTAFMPFPGKPVKSNSITERIFLKDENNHVRICVFDQNGIETKGDFLYVNAPEVKKRNLYFIGMGVSQYLDKSKNLKYAAKDVNDVMNFFKSNNNYVTKNFYLLTNEKAIGANVADSVKKFLSTANEEDQVIFFFAGHGVIADDGQYYLATHNLDFKLPQSKGLNINTINDLLSASKARKKMMFIDACHSGLIEDIAIAETGVANPLQKDVVMPKRGVDFGDGLPTTSSQVYFAFDQFNQGSGIDIISAAAGNEYAYEAINKVPNGVFTYNLLKALKTAEADYNQDKMISIAELQNYVAKATLKMTGGMQKPAFRQSNIYQDLPVLSVSDSYTGQWLNAASTNRVALLQQLLKQGVEIDVVDEDGFTALHFASRQGSLAAAEFLVAQKANLLLKSKWGFSALYLAAFNGHEAITYILLNNGAKVADLPEFQLKAIREKGNKTINHLLEDFDNVKAKEEKQIAFNKQIAENKLAEIEEKLKLKLVDLDYFCITTGTSPVFIAIVKKKYEALKMLFNYGANANYVNEVAKISALMLAVYVDDTEAIRILLEAKADKNLKDSNGKTALDYAIELKRASAITLLR